MAKRKKINNECSCFQVNVQKTLIARIIPGKWYVYMLRCSDSSLYTGITNNLKERLIKHNSGKGAKYTKSRLPVDLMYYEKCSSRSLATIRESEIKQYSKNKKEKMVVNA